MVKYWQLFRISVKQRHVFVFNAASSLFSYAIRIFLIVTLFRYLNAHSPEMFAEYSVLELSWALIFAQIGAIAVPKFSAEISEDVKSGKVSVYLLNPISYPVFKAFETLSGIFHDLLFLIFAAVAIGGAFVGFPEITFASVVWGAVFLVGSIILVALTEMQVGLFAFLIEDVAPLRWIVHKMRMLFGGNILPIALMPLWLQTVAFASPFAYTGYTAGLTFARFDPATFARYFLMQCFWIGALMASIALSYSYFSRRLAVNGG